MKSKGVPADALKALSSHLIRHTRTATPEALHSELLMLATHWDRLSQSVRKEYVVQMCTEDEDDELTEEDWDIVNKPCKKCAACCYFFR